MLAIEPLSRPPMAAVRVPGSKSITNRALILAAFTDPQSTTTLTGILRSEDTEVMVQALRTLGFRLDVDWNGLTIRVERPTGHALIPGTSADLFVANSGTSMRFLTALLGLGHGTYRLDGVARMRERPIEDLLEALRSLGVQARSELGTGCPPVVLEASGLRGGTVAIRTDTSSQFLSGLLMAAPWARQALEIQLQGVLVSEPYVQMTLAMLREFGAEFTRTDNRLSVQPRATWFAPRTYAIEPDASAASYFFGAAAITGGEVTVLGLPEQSLQGDVHFVNVLREMGCSVEWQAEGCTIRGGRLHGIVVDMNAISDCVMTLAAVASFAEGPTTIHNVAHIRHKETDRLAALATELRRAGVGVEELADGLVIHPAPLRPTTFATYNDHRMAMSLALLGLKSPGMVLENPGCVAKTYPAFFQDLQLLRGEAV